MPRRDGTGPDGIGAMTGRAEGDCVGYGVPDATNLGGGRGMGFRRGGGGGGCGWRHMHRATGMPGWMRGGWGAGTPFVAPVAAPTPEMEKHVLENQLSALQAQLDAVRKRLDEVSAQTEEEKS